MPYTVKILDSICREVTAEEFGSAFEANRAAEKLCRSFKRLYIQDPEGKLTLYVDGYRVTQERQLQIPLAIEVPQGKKNPKVVALDAYAVPDQLPIANCQ